MQYLNLKLNEFADLSVYRLNIQGKYGNIVPFYETPYKFRSREQIFKSMKERRKRKAFFEVRQA